MATFSGICPYYYIIGARPGTASCVEKKIANIFATVSEIFLTATCLLHEHTCPVGYCFRAYVSFAVRVVGPSNCRIAPLLMCHDMCSRYAR